MLDPRRLLTFYEVARRRSFSGAATALSLTQPAVSQQIRLLETQLGERLIDRRHGRFELTGAGKLLFAHAEGLAQRLRLAEVQVAEVLASARSLLRLGAFPSLLVSFVPSMVRRLRASGHELKLSVIEGSTDELVNQVRDGRLHLALCFQNAAAERLEYEETRRHDLFEEPMVAALPPGHRLAKRARIRLSDLRDETWLAATRHGLTYQACIAAGFEPRVDYLTADPLASRGLVAAGLAVMITPKLLAPDLRGIATPTLVNAPHRAVYALTPSRGRHPAVELFLAALHTESRGLGKPRQIGGG